MHTSGTWYNLHGKMTTKTGRHSKFTSEQEVVIVREVAAAEVHVAALDETRTRFGTAAEKLMENNIFSQELNWKIVEDRDKRLQKQHDCYDKHNQRLSEVGRVDMGELADLIMTKCEVRDYMNDKTPSRVRRRERKRRRRSLELDLWTQPDPEYK